MWSISFASFIISLSLVAIAIQTMKIKIAYLPALLITLSGSVFAGGGWMVFAVPGGTGSETQTKAYAGLAWTLGNQKSMLRPDLVVGVRSLKVKFNDQVNSGLDLSARFSFASNFAFDSVRLSYVGGNRDLLGNLGIGYSNTSKSYLTTLAAQGAYSRAGVDYEFNRKTLLPYFELLTVNKPKNVSQDTTLACPPGWTVPPGARVGDSCHFSILPPPPV